MKGHVAMWCPYHRERLLWWMPEESGPFSRSPEERWEYILYFKPEVETWTRLEAFQPVKHPELLPSEANWDLQFGMNQNLFNYLNAMRKWEYPDAPEYDYEEGLVFPDGYKAPR